MYNKQYFETGNDYKITGNYCIHRYSDDYLFDNDDINGVITKYDCNHIVAWIHRDGTIEKYPIFDDGSRYYIFGDNMLNRIYKASKQDNRVFDLYDRIDNYNHDYISDNYILRYSNKDLLN